ncbi:LamG domain-containing protein [bacterium]|nr:LamG domain-containing protein [bacterium]
MRQYTPILAFLLIGLLALTACQKDEEPAETVATAEAADAGPVIHLTFDESDGTDVLKDAAHNYDQMLLSTSGPVKTEDHSVEGIVGNAIQLDGETMYIEDDTHTWAQQVFKGDFTLATWIALKEGPRLLLYPIFEQTSYDPDRDEMRSVYIKKLQGSLQFQIGVRYGAWSLPLNLNNQADGQWRHYVIRRRGTEVTYLVDGKTVLQKSSGRLRQPFYLEDSPRSTILIGTTAANRSIFGKFKIDDFQAWDRALSDEEIASVSTR